MLQLETVLDSFFSHRDPLEPGAGIVVAFSGGPDSTALLWGMARLADRRHLRLTAAHLDHGLDPCSPQRALAAKRLAEQIGVAMVVERREVPRLRLQGESDEMAARRVRYGFLEEIRRRQGAVRVATAHHRDDQAETVLLRVLFGTGLEGLAGIRRQQGPLVRPLLDLPREELFAAISDSGLSPVDDPTNLDLSLPRNRVRHLLLPRLQQDMPDIMDLLARLAERAARSRQVFRRHLVDLLSPRPIPDGIAITYERFARLPMELQPMALALLHRRAGAPYPASKRARAELLRQLTLASTPTLRHIGCDCGGGWRWESRGGSIALVGKSRASQPFFAYTFQVPGERVIREIHRRIRVSRGPVAEWMFRGSPIRAGLALPIVPGDRVVVRNRWAGDRLQPLGSPGRRRLKEVLIDNRVPRYERDQLPLLVVGGQIAWVPGVTIDDRFRLAGEESAWIAELEPL